MEKVLDFWFQELSQDDWFSGTIEIDQLIKGRFLALYREAVAGELWRWRETPEGSLAEVIVLDQFSRNIYRGTPGAFATDPQALVLAQVAVARGFDQKLPTEQRRFLYMPYMHSESKVIHEEAVKLFTALGSEVVLGYELKHKEIIDRFGRYPHRNSILNRETTAEEHEFLKDNPGF